MLDTIRLQSPPLDMETYKILLDQASEHRIVDLGTGEFRTLATSVRVECSSGASVRAELRDWEYRPVYDRSGKHRPVRFPCEPYAVVEGSAHKLMLGHNVAGGPEDLQPTARYLVDLLGVNTETELPDGSDWYLRRVDRAEAYDLGSAGAVEYLRVLCQARYPRRKMGHMQTESVFTKNGRTTAVKAYSKGPEFAKHDARELRKHGWHELADQVQALADGLIRTEVGIRDQKLDQDFGCKPRVRDVSDEYVAGIATDEVARLLREGDGSMRIVRKHEEVIDRLGEVYSGRWPAVLLSTWMGLSALGEDRMRSTMKRATFYLHRKMLQDARISWLGSDIGVVGGFQIVPDDFRPLPSDPRCLRGEDPRVVQALAPYRAAA
jgi:II/X family phage/plasmid replication protein